jgi:predicted regulator of Ras-like GTPase activity (Roadblock/LC7/MglB family)
LSAEALDVLLGQLNAFPGVIGSMVCGELGEVLADAFPAGTDPAVPARAAQVLADHANGLAAIGGPVTMLSLRFGSARILVRRLGGGHLLVLCAPTVNPQPLTLLAAATAPKLERLLAPAPPPAPRPIPPPVLPRAAAPAPAPAPAPVAVAPAPPAAVSALYLVAQRIEAIIVKKKLDPFRTRGAISMKAGFGLRAIDVDTPDDPDMLEKLLAAATAVLGEKP